MRLLTAFLWSAATLMWIPWFAVLVRFMVDLANGTAWADSQYLNPALIFVWPLRGWLHWGIVSWVPLVGVLAMLVVYIGWRFFWWEQDWRSSYSTSTVALSILVPPLALILLYRDARRRFTLRNAELREAAHEDVEAIDGDTLQLLT